MGVRQNVRNQAARDAYIQGCVGLSTSMTGLTAADVDAFFGPRVPGWSMRGVNVELSWWDLFTLWHHVTMEFSTGPNSNRAHSGPVFLPWHRLFLIRLEEQLQTTLGDPDFGLPYWDWAQDRQVGNNLWAVSRLGTNRGTVDSGPVGGLRVRLSGVWTRTERFLEAHPGRPIERRAGLDGRWPSLPRKANVAACLLETDYDTTSFDAISAGFRNHVEGGRPGGMHNLVHMWMGGDMGPSTSPNDPVFYLNHCNVDRIWQARMQAPGGLAYAPIAGGPGGHNLNDPLVAVIGEELTPADVLDPSDWYSYDNLNVAS